VTETEWKFNKTGHQCAHCSSPFAPDAVFFSVLFKDNEGMRRADYCDTCFQNHRPADVFYFWKTTLARHNQGPKKARPALDMEYVLEFFKRLEGDSSSQRIAFRYILALMLSRKKMLTVAEKKKDDQNRVVQHYREKIAGAETVIHAVVEPDLSEDEIQGLSAELGVLLGMTPAPEPSAPEAPVAPEVEVATSEAGGDLEP